MTNLLETGLKWLSKKQKKHVSSKVLYCRDGKQYPVDAVLGRTKYEIVDENGFKIAGHAIDFLIAAADLPLIPQEERRRTSGSAQRAIRWEKPSDAGFYRVIAVFGTGRPFSSSLPRSLEECHLLSSVVMSNWQFEQNRLPKEVKKRPSSFFASSKTVWS